MDIVDKKLLISKDYLLFSFILLFYVPSAYLVTFGPIARVYYYGRMLLSLVVLIYWLLSKSSELLWIGSVAVFYSWLLIASLYNNASASILRQCAEIMFFGVTFVMLIDMYTSYDYFRTVKAIRRTLEILFWINFLSVIIFPEGLYIAVERNQNQGYFLGMRNNTIEIILPLLGTSIIEEYFGKLKKGHTLLLSIAALVTYLISSSSNSLLCVAFLIAYFIFLYKKPHMKFMNIWTYLAASVASTLLIVVWDFEQYFEYIIVELLGKNLNFTGRDTIWQRSIYYISKRYLFGYGVESDEMKMAKIQHPNSCHNYYLDLLYYGGIFMTLIMLVVLLLLIFRNKKLPDLKDREVLVITIGAYFILWIATPIHRDTISYMFMFWTVVYKFKGAPGSIEEYNEERNEELETVKAEP